MIRFDGVLHRANLYNLGEFILTGSECCLERSYESYSHQLKVAQDQASSFFKTHFPHREDYDEVSEVFYQLAGVFQDVYFEMGLLLGARTALQISKRMEELR